MTKLTELQYRAVFPTYEQLQADGGWDEAILKNLLATQTQRKVSSESATTTTTNGSSTARASSDAMASTVVNGSAVVPPSIHTLLEGTVPLPTSVSKRWTENLFCRLTWYRSSILMELVTLR